MKRHGKLLTAIADVENLRLAFWKAAKGKRAKADCRIFRDRLDFELASLRRQMLSGSVPVGRYHYFAIHDPKERVICAASFRERVLHHALMNICEPILERAAIFDSYACRKGKGQLAAVQRASGYTRKHRWFLKLDVRKYFDSVDHKVLNGLLSGKFKDAVLLGVFADILASYQTSPGKGLPIGNLTSQHFANFYLAPLDRFIKETLGRKAYVRYMDDFVVWGDSRSELAEVWRKVAAFLDARLKLTPKANGALNRTAHGVEFLGYRLYPGMVRLARRSKVRFARKFRRYEAAHRCGQWNELQLQQRMQALVAFTLPARSRAYRRCVIKRFGVAAIGLEPRETRRQLEQQRDQLPDSEPQQQQPEQQQQQHRVPLCASPSSTRAPERARTDPAALPSQMPHASGQTGSQTPSGASRLEVPVEPSGRGAPSSPLRGVARSTRFSVLQAVLLSGCLLTGTASTASGLERTIMAGGETALPDDYPSNRLDPLTATSPFNAVGALQIFSGGWNYKGSGTALSPNWVLTAAHNLDTNDDGAPDVGLAIDFHLPGFGIYTATAFYTCPDFTGFAKPSVQRDLGLLYFDSPLPSNLFFPSLGYDLQLGDEVALVGYGRSGYGSYGYTTDASLTDRRIGYNVVDTLTSDDQGGGFDALFRYDFDAPDSFGQSDGSLGNDVESIIGPGDSGGPLLVDLGGGYALAGVNTFIEGYGGRFGDIGGGVVLDPYLDWISTTTGIVVPEPSVSTLLLVLVFLLCRGSNGLLRSEKHGDRGLL